MGLPNELHPLQLAASSGGYEIEQSLRLNKTDQSYVNKVFTSAGDEQKFTLSFWFKICHISKSTADNLAGAGDDGNNYFNIDIEKTSVGEFLHIFNYTPAHGYEFDLKTNRLIRDPSAWMHLVLAVDTTQATASDRVKVWLNGVRETSFATENYPAQNRSNLWWGGNTTNGVALSNQETAFGRRPPGGPEYANAYIAEANSIDGQYLTHEDFGEFDNNGVWRPIKYTGTYTGNSFYLKFDASDVDGDSSGLGNDFTANNITTSGTGTDVMIDTPTNNFCTLNPLYYTASGITQSDGNLKVTFPSAPPNGMRGGTLATTNAFYFEAKATAASSNQVFVGVQPPDWANNTTTYPGKGPDGWGYQASGAIVNNNSTVTTVSSWTAGDIIGVACHPSSGTIQFFKNGTSVYSGTSVANVPMTIGVAQVGGSGNSGAFVVNCGQRAFEYTPPTGFKTLSTDNIPAPTVKDGSKYFNATTYNGDGGANQSITGVGFQPDWLWIKQRNSTENHRAVDSVRGVGSGTGETKMLVPNETGAEGSNSQIASFDSDGWTFNSSDNGINGSGQTYVGWTWKANGSGSSNTNGSITSTVSANPTAGFSIVTWTGTGNNDSYGHGLGVKPAMIIHKRRNSTSDWHVWHQGLPTANPTYDVIYLNLNNGQNSGNNNVFRQDPTSTLIYTGTAGSHNVSGGTYVDYVFAEVEGYSKFGSYTGNGSTDGPFVYCGFKPELIIYKRTDAGGAWLMYDATRSTGNGPSLDKYIRANNNSAEDSDGAYATTEDVDLVSNGFKIRDGGGDVNTSGATYIFACFASNPFGGSSVSPATAR